MKFSAKNLEETQKIASDFISNIAPNENGATVVGLYGDLGAGKTSFVQGVAKKLGVSENVISPTFVIMKFYSVQTQSDFENLVHIDAYRIENPNEILNLGWQKIISNPKNLILIEWPERILSVTYSHIKITFSHIEEGGREIELVV